VSGSPRVVYEFAKNSRESVRATLTEFRGYPVADLRVWVECKETDGAAATKKGITIRIGDLPNMLAAVEALIAEVGLVSEQSERIAQDEGGSARSGRLLAENLR
jgi:hypothetical protein